jgi:hypothetical protein
MYAGYLALNSMLVLAFFWAFAHGSPVLSDDADIPGSFNDQFNVDLRGDGLPLRRIHHRYLFKRDLHHELFEPRSELQLDVLLGTWLMFGCMRALIIIHRSQCADFQLCSR